MMSAFKSLQDSVRSRWTSERLIYRAMEDNEADRAFFHKYIVGDPNVLSLFYTNALRPQSRSMANVQYDSIRNRMLSVFVCLPTDKYCSESDSSRSDASSSGGSPVLEAIEVSARRGAPTLVPIGIAALTSVDPEDRQHRNTFLGIGIIDAYQGNGYGPEAINWVLDWAFNSAAMHRVSLTCYGFNERAQRVYERLGFVKEGIIRECHWFDRAWHDHIKYGMLESEWEKLRLPQMTKLDPSNGGYLTPMSVGIDGQLNLCEAHLMNAAPN